MITGPKIYKMRIAFTVAGVWDHKQIMSALRTMVLHSGLAFEPAKVNPNWPRLAYGPVLGYGQYSKKEIADLYFSTPVEVSQAQAALHRAAPDGVCVLRVWRVPYALPSVNHLAEVMKYSVQGDFAQYAPACRAEDFFSAKQVYVQITAANAMTVQQDVKPFLLRVKQLQENELELLLQRQADKWAKPEHLIAAWLQVPIPADTPFTLQGIKFTREELYWRDEAGNLHAI